MHRIICLRFNMFKKYFTKKTNNRNSSDSSNSSDNYFSDDRQNNSEILFTQMNQMMKSDFENVYAKLEVMDNKIKIINDKIELVLAGINDMRKSEEIVLINN